MYIGQADDLRRRIEQHHGGPNAKGFWTRCVAFHSRDDSFNNAHVRRIESMLIARANQAKRATLDNGNQPGVPALSEADTSEADTFLDEMLVLLPLLDVDAFTLPTSGSVKTGPGLRLAGRGIKASGRESPDGFVVLAGSRAARDGVASLPESVRKRRADLLARGVLAEDPIEDPTSLRLTQDYLFDSPSMAAAVLLGRTANGRVEWKDDASGRSLKDIQGIPSAE